MPIFTVPDSDCTPSPEIFAEVNHCHGSGRGHPCTGTGAAGTLAAVGHAVGTAAYAVGRAVRTVWKDESGGAGFKGGTRSTKMAMKRMHQAVDAAALAVGELSTFMHEHSVHEDEKVAHSLHLGEAALEIALHAFPELLRTVTGGRVRVGEAAAAPHAALPELLRLQGLYTRLQLPASSPHQSRLVALQQRIAQAVAAAQS